MEFEFVVVSAHLAGMAPVNIGILLVDQEAGQFHYRFRTDFSGMPQEDAQVLGGLPEYYLDVVRQEGADGLLAHLTRDGANAVQVTPRCSVTAASAGEAMDYLYAVHVEGSAPE